MRISFLDPKIFKTNPDEEHNIKAVLRYKGLPDKIYYITNDSLKDFYNKDIDGIVFYDKNDNYIPTTQYQLLKVVKNKLILMDRAERTKNRKMYINKKTQLPYKYIGERDFYLYFASDPLIWIYCFFALCLLIGWGNIIFTLFMIGYIIYCRWRRWSILEYIEEQRENEILKKIPY